MNVQVVSSATRRVPDGPQVASAAPSGLSLDRAGLRHRLCPSVANVFAHPLLDAIYDFAIAPASAGIVV